MSATPLVSDARPVARSRADVLALLTMMVLLFSAVVQRIYVLPVFVSIMASLEAPLSPAARLALSVGGGLWDLALLAFFATLLWLGWRRRTGGRAAVWFHWLLHGGNLVLTVFLALLLWTFVDVAIGLPANIMPRPSALAPPVR